jgi:signal transduction histidine kinase
MEVLASNRAESLRIAILRAVGDDRAMEKLLAGLMERAQAEFCAFYTERERELLYLVVESRELSPRIPEIREKLRRTYRMFANEPGPDVAPVELVSFRRGGPNVAYLLGNSKIESYFLIPVLFDSRVRGVLYFGSVRKEAFGRNEIAELRSLADEGEARLPLIFKVGGEKEILEGLLEALPEGAALISPAGEIVCANAPFAEALRLRGPMPETLAGLAKESPFNLRGVWDEFKILKRNLIDRELAGVCAPERYLAVTWIRLDRVSEDVESIVLLKDVTGRREYEERREETMATVAHEIRTPLAALKNSLAILALERTGFPSGGASADGGDPAGRPAFVPRVQPEAFFKNALRTVDRLGRLVDGLIDASEARADERPLKLEEVEAREFLEGASMLFAEPLRMKGIGFSVAVDPPAGRLVIDRDRVEQVIQNLLANSLKHVPSGGSIALSVAPLRGSSARVVPDDIAERVGGLRFDDLRVADTGSGIPREVIERVNPEAGFPERPARASRGLGLYIARRLVRMTGGSLAIEGSVAEGSVVHLYLPADERTANVVRRYRAVEAAVAEMMARGDSPVVYCVRKDGVERWDEVARLWHPPAALDPPHGGLPDRPAGLWPLGDAFGIAVCDAARGACETGFARAVGPSEGSSLAELLAIASKRMDDRALLSARKGEVE